MKTRTKKILYAVPMVVLLVLCVCLIRMIPGDGGGEELPVMGTPSESEGETEGQPAETQTEETEPPETEPIVDLSSKGLLYTSLGNGTCLVSGIGTCTDSVVIIPEKSPEGDTIVGIGSYAFRGCMRLRGIELTPNIRSIGAYAFYGSSIEAVFVPAETTNIGEYAFCGCYSLRSIVVSPDNPNYADESGVLTSKSGDVILAYPAGRGDNFYSISSKVREIRTMAFYNCHAIKLIHYAGGLSAFRQILIGAGNEALESAVITYSSTADLFTEGGVMGEAGVESEK